MRGSKAKRLRANVRAALGMETCRVDGKDQNKIPRGNRYQLKNQRYFPVYDPELQETVDELYSATFSLHPEEPRAVYRNYKRILKRSGEHE